MIRKVLGLAVVASAVIAVAACGDDEPTVKYPNAGSFCEAKATAECKVAAPGCGVTEDVCKQKAQASCNSFAGAATVSGRTYNAANAENCVNLTTALYSDRVIDPIKEKNQQDACQKAFVGKVAKNLACTGFECEGSLLCDPDKKVCATKTAKAEGDQCNNAGDICEETTLYCKKGANDLKSCAKLVAQGQPCDDANPCAKGLFCSGTCVAKKASGEECNAAADCATGACGGGTPKKCVARSYASETGTCADFGGT